MREVDFENGLIGKYSEYTIRVRQIFAPDIFGASGEEKDSFMLLAGGG